MVRASSLSYRLPEMGGPGMRAKSWIPLVVVAVGLAVVPSGAASQAQTGAAHVVTHRSTFVPGDDDLAPLQLTITQGATLTITNLDAFAGHELNSDDRVADGPDQDTDPDYLFASAGVNFRGSAPVVGVEALAPGTYGFHCAVHLDNMHGTLVVL